MEFVNNFFGQISLGEYAAFIAFCLIGMGLIKTIRYNNKKKAGLRENPVRFTKFSRKIWIADNLLDFIIAFVTAFLCFRFFPDALSFIKGFLPVGEFEEKMFYGLLLGLAFQYILHRLMNKVKI